MADRARSALRASARAFAQKRREQAKSSSNKFGPHGSSEVRPHPDNELGSTAGARDDGCPELANGWQQSGSSGMQDDCWDSNGSCVLELQRGVNVVCDPPRRAVEPLSVEQSSRWAVVPPAVQSSTRLATKLVSHRSVDRRTTEPASRGAVEPSRRRAVMPSSCQAVKPTSHRNVEPSSRQVGEPSSLASR